MEEPCCDQSKRLSNYIPYEYFKNGKFTQLQIPHSRKGFSLQDRFKRCLFLNSNSRIVKEICEFFMVWQLIEVSLPVFGLYPTPKIFTKLLKVPVALSRRIHIRLVVYLDHILLMGQMIEELLAAKIAIFTYMKERSIITIHLQMDNKTVHSYLVNMERPHNNQLLGISKQI